MCLLLCLARRFALNAPCPVDGDWHTRTTHSADPGEAKGFSEGRPLATVRDGGGAEVDGHPFQLSLSQVPPGAWALARAQPPGPPQPQALHSAPSSPGDRILRGAIHRRPGHLPPSSCSTTALIGENLQECSSDGMTWNCFSAGWGRTKHSFLCWVLVWMGQLCVGVFFCVLFCFSSLFWFCFGFF